MSNKETVLVVDAGNTSVKFGVFILGELTENHRFNLDETSEMKLLLDRFNKPPTILSSVLDTQNTISLVNLLVNCILIDQTTLFPITFNYTTLNSLGIDRICNAVAISKSSPNTHAISIDIGTCIKFDLVDNNSIYQGGSISPGINLRYKSLNDYTSNLPLLKETKSIDLVGKSTYESIQSGVLNGIQAEINHLMQRYTMEYKDLTFFMTGGDIQYFDFPIKNNIFVDENLTLKGLYQIYLLNAH